MSTDSPRLMKLMSIKASRAYDSRDEYVAISRKMRKVKFKGDSYEKYMSDFYFYLFFLERERERERDSQTMHDS